MGKLVVSTQMTIDGVIDQTDRWFDGNADSNRLNLEELRAADALLLGRITYEGLARVWPTMDDGVGFAELINPMPKYVASRDYDKAMQWNATLIEGDLIEQVGRLKLDKNLVVYGCGELALTLARAGLVDAIRLGVHPTVFRNGTRLFFGDDPIKLELVSATGFESGFVELVYRPAAASFGA